MLELGKAREEAVTPVQLQEIKARCDAASPGPWREATNGIISGAEHTVVSYIFRTRPKDMEFISRVRSDIPALISEIERLNTLLEQDAALMKGQSEEIEKLKEVLFSEIAEKRLPREALPGLAL